jgi:DNA recombination protein RmuC
MNSLVVVAALLIAVGAVAWAVIQSGRAARAMAEAAAAGRDETALKGLAALTAREVADTLVTRAAQTFEAQQKLSQEKIDAQLKPVAETLAKFEKKVADADKARAEEAGGLKTQIAALAAATAATQAEASKLSTALRRGTGVQGRWGEHVLHNVLELAGMKAGLDFDEQVTSEAGDLRPDVTVRLPGGARFVIDAKCSLAAYLEAQDSVDEGQRDGAYGRHAASVRGHMLSLSAKAYWDQFESSPDFVAMFIPGDAFLSAAIDRIPDLYAQAMDKRVILVTPSSLFALCKAVVYGYRVEDQAANAREIAELGRELHKRLSVMGGHVAALGKSLEAAVGRYNAFVGSLETQVLTQARRFETLKVDHQGAALKELEPIETAARPLVKLSAEAANDALTPGEAAPTCAP